MVTLAEIAHINTNDTVIVASNRKVIALQRQFFAQRNVTILPKITTIENMLIERVNQKILNKFQIFFIMRELIEPHIKFNNQTIYNLFNDYIKLRQYKISLDDISATSDKQNFFSSVIQKYYRHKTKNKLFDIFDAYSIVKKCSGDCYHFGFKTIVPINKELFNNLGSIELKHSSGHHDINNFKFHDAKQEVKHVVNWAFDLYSKNKSQSIVVVHPKLSSYRSVLSYQFNKKFKEHNVATKDKSFNISLGKPLLNYKLCADLLLILEMHQQIIDNKINVNDLITICSSTYLDFTDTICKKIYYYQRHDYYINNQQFVEICDKFKNIVALTKRTKKASHEFWATFFNNILNNWGFLKHKNLTSDEYQVFNKIKSQLAIVNVLPYKEIDYKSAIDMFVVLQSTIFSPQSGNNQIQIMGILEAEGLYFDHAWIMDLEQNNLPGPLKIPEYLPMELVTKVNMLKSNFDNNLKDAKLSIKLLKSLANKVNFSCNLQAQNLAKTPSIMIDWGKSIMIHNATDNNCNANKIKLDQQASKFNDTYLKNATTVIKEQNLCAFRGFANRLNIATVDTDYIGIDPKQRGNILHKTLELLYDNIKSKQHLQEITDLKDKIITAFDKAICQIRDKKTNFLPHNVFIDLEKQCITEKINKFLQLEKTRDDFTIEALEQEKDVVLNKLSFKIRIDRIDKDDKGNLIILDYKTGSVSTSFIYRLSELQLPIYALFISSQALGFVDFKEKVNYKYIADCNLLPGRNGIVKNISYNKQISIWRQQISAIVDDFISGNAKITPSATNCLYCNLENLCRKSDVI